MYIHKSCYGLCPRCVWRYNEGCSEWQREDNNMNEDYIGTPMEGLDAFQRQLKRFDIKERDVVHQKTCPVCGRKLVNLYRRNHEWKCRSCWEGHNEQR